MNPLTDLPQVSCPIVSPESYCFTCSILFPLSCLVISAVCPVWSYPLFVLFLHIHCLSCLVISTVCPVSSYPLFVLFRHIHCLSCFPICVLFPPDPLVWPYPSCSPVCPVCPRFPIFDHIRPSPPVCPDSSCLSYFRHVPLLDPSRPVSNICPVPTCSPDWPDPSCSFYLIQLCIQLIFLPVNSKSRLYL